MDAASSKNLFAATDSRGVVTVTLHVPGKQVNVLSERVFSELQTIIDWLERESTARLVLFRSGKDSGFLAGADLRELSALRSPETADQVSLIGQKVFDRLERLSVPTVVAIRGPCLGGGLELALACRYRLLCDEERTQLAVPEVELGLLPAWGGTQRLPERVGVTEALRMLLDSRRLSASQAVEIGLADRAWPPERFDEGVEHFISERLAGTSEVERPPPGARERVSNETRHEWETLLRVPEIRLAQGDARTARARAVVLAVVERGLRSGREAGLAQERAAFAELLFTPECRELLEQFFARHRARAVPAHSPRAEKVEKADESETQQGTATRSQIPLGNPDSQPWVAGLTIGEALRETARKFADRPAMVFRHAGVRWTWAEFDREVDRVARGLLALGLQRGDHFGVWSSNWPEWVLFQFATARIGVVLVTINPAYRATELQYALAQSEVRGLALVERFKKSNFLAMLSSVCPELERSRPGELRSDAFPNLKWIVGLRGVEHPGIMTWRGFEAAADTISAAVLEEAQRRLDPGDPINLQYTSGTTGAPKGALLSHRNLLLNAFYASDGQRLDERDSICVPVPLYHCFGCVLGTMCAIVRGTTLVFPNESFDPESTLAAIEAERCTAVYGVPTMFIGELENPSFPERDTSSLRTGIMAGSPCPIELMKRVVRDMGAREITIAYGQTEASPLATMTRTDDPIEKRVSTVGRPLPGIEVKIVDLLSGETLPDDQSGELCCRGHNVMLGYYNMPEATARAIDSEGWLHTGDLALRQPDGYFRVTGRIKEIIIRGGENIAPREIEELLYQHPAVEQVAVLGVPDRRFGEEVLAWIKLREGKRVTEHEIREFCRQHLAHFKTPRYVRFVDSFPTTVTGKVQKYKIRERAIEELGLREAAAIETA